MWWVWCTLLLVTVNSGSVPVTLDSDGTALYVDLSLNGQPMRLVLDTSTGELISFRWRECSLAYFPCYMSTKSANYSFRQATTAVFNLEFDGDSLTESDGRVGSDLLSFYHPTGDLSDVTVRSEIILSSSQSLIFVPGNFPYHNLSKADGIWGVSMEGLAGFSCGGRSQPCTTIQKILKQTSGLNDSELTMSSQSYSFGLQVVPENNYSSSLDIPAQPMQNASTAEIDSLFPRKSYHLQLYNVSICGVSLLSNYSTNWNAVIDTSAACLGLPTEFFNVLMTWIPSNCFRTTNSNGNHIRTCYLPTNFLEDAPLPFLSFRLSMDPNAEVLYIPIKDLLLPSLSSEKSDPMRRRFCIVEQTSLEEHSFGNRIITFGFRTLIPFYTMFDLAESRIRLKQNQRTLDLYNLKSLNVSKLDASCAARKVCSSYQIFDSATNACINPSCGYYLYSSDSTSGKCRIHYAVTAVGLLCIALFGIGEVFLYTKYLNLLRHILQ